MNNDIQMNDLGQAHVAQNPLLYAGR